MALTRQPRAQQVRRRTVLMFVREGEVAEQRNAEDRTFGGKFGRQTNNRTETRRAREGRRRRLDRIGRQWPIDTYGIEVRRSDYSLVMPCRGFPARLQPSSSSSGLKAIQLASRNVRVRHGGGHPFAFDLCAEDSDDARPSPELAMSRSFRGFLETRKFRRYHPRLRAGGRVRSVGRASERVCAIMDVRTLAFGDLAAIYSRRHDSVPAPICREVRAS
ncbi:hypothetical protein L226DRAFT_187571 [Lentinus tigrinus ALCF2SS1-7]|uniref:Uncharacterized protein n=1 Tax=Lentinus tigrinus ALCF2SS1-6 TaxID=1328759 RepID=A0A5C2SQH3_9APHY|nr:hypothetical protein L227DRAFT_130912 [Lentinus tigrinus ALCF2SS1-6]RPD79988.1 hypothetical protein L226DRAFT_187571 [Lentinus tigrinus ALCF2SS1-7]